MQAVSYHTITWRGGLPSALQVLSDLGFHTFEAGNLQNWFRRRDELDGYIRALGIRPVGLYLGGCHIYPEDHELELSLVDAACRLLGSYGAKHLVIGGGHIRPEGPDENDYAVLARVLDDMGAWAKDYGIQVCYHPHCGTLVETRSQVARVAEVTDADLVQFCLDVAHIAQAGGDPVAMCEEFYDRVAYVHLKDLDEAGNFVELGQGGIDLRGVVDVLRERGFAGPIVIEIDGSDDPAESARRNRDFAVEQLGLAL